MRREAGINRLEITKYVNSMPKSRRILKGAIIFAENRQSNEETVTSLELLFDVATALQAFDTTKNANPILTQQGRMDIAEAYNRELGGELADNTPLTFLRLRITNIPPELKEEVKKIDHNILQFYNRTIMAFAKKFPNVGDIRKTEVLNLAEQCTDYKKIAFIKQCLKRDEEHERNKDLNQ